MSANTLSIIFILIFIVLILAVILSSFLGYKKGIYRVITNMVVKGLFILALVFSSSSIAKIVGDINIQNIFSTSEEMSLHSYLIYYISETGLFSPMNSLSIYASITTIVDSLLTYIIFFIGLILIQIFAPFISLALYNGVIKIILPIENKNERFYRRNKKEKYQLTKGLKIENNTAPKRKLPLFKIPSCILNGVLEMMFVIILLAPFSSFIKIINDNRKSIDSIAQIANIDEETRENYSSYIDVSSSSLLYKMSAPLNFDDVLMNKVSSVDLNGMSVSFSNLIYSFFDVSKPLLDSDTISYDTTVGAVTINYAQLFSVAMIDTIIERVLANDMILAVLPPLLDAAINTATSNSVAFSELSLSDIDWTNELTIIKSIYGAIYETGIEPMISDNKFSIENFSLKTSEFTDEQIETYVDAISKLGELESFKKNIATVLTGAGVFLNNLGYNILPTYADAYKDIDWSNDLRIFSNTLFKFLRLISLDISSSMDLFEFKEKFFACLENKEKRDLLETYICGEGGIFDSDVISVLSMPTLFKTTFSYIPAMSNFMSYVDFDTLLADYDIFKVKDELINVFDVLDLLYAENSPIDLNHIEDIDLSDENTVIIFSQCLSLGSKSQLFKTIYPFIIKSVLFNNNFDFSKYLFGLSPYNFNYDSEYFINDFIELLNLFVSIRIIQNILEDSSLSNSEKLDEIDISVLKDLLEFITSSTFFNSDLTTGTSSSSQKNVNIYVLIKTLFSYDLFTSIGFVTPDLSSLQDITWGGSDGEINKIISFLNDLKVNASYFTSTEKDLTLLNDTSNLASLYKTGLSSTILEPTVLSVINNSLNDYLNKLGFHLSLNEMRSALWIDDSDDIEELLSILQDVSIKDFNYKNLDYIQINALFTCLYKSNIVKYGYKENDNFGYLLYEFFVNNDLYSLNDYSLITSSDFDSTIKNISWCDNTIPYEYTFTKDGVTYLRNYTITDKGEIFNLSMLIKYIEECNQNEFGNGVLNSSFVSNIKELTSSSFIRKLLSCYFTYTINNLSLPSSLSSMFNNASLSSLSTLNEEAFNNEIDVIYFIYSLCNTTYENTTLFDFMISNIYSLSNYHVSDETSPTLYEEFILLLDHISSSYLFNSSYSSTYLSPMANLFKGIIVCNDLTKRVTLSNSESSLNAILKTTSYIDEIDYLKEIVKNVQGITSFSVYSSLDSKNLSTILKSFNKSSIFHRASISIIKDIYSEIKLDDMTLDSSSSIKNHINYFVHLSSSSDDISYWDNEIKVVNGLISSFTSLIEENKSLKDIDACSTSYDFIYYLAISDLLSENRAILIYNIFDSNSYSVNLFSLISPSSEVYNQNSCLEKIENLLFIDDAHLDNLNNPDKNKYDKEAAILKNTVSLLFKNVSSFSTSTDLSSLSFEELFNATVSLDNAVLFRSKLASEMVSNSLKLIFNNSTYSSLFFNVKSLFDSSSSLYANSDYQLINTIEGRGIDGLIKLKDSSSAYFKYEELKPIFELFGTTLTTTIDQDKFDYFNAIYKNSKIVTSELAYINNIQVKDIDSDSIVFLSSHLSLNETSLENKTYSELLLTIKEDIE